METQSHVRNELALKGSRVAIWDWDIQSGEAYFNERWFEIMGRKPDEAKDHSFNTWVLYAHPKDLKKSNLLLKEHLKGSTEYYDTIARMKHINGKWVWIHSRGKVFEWDKEGNPLRMCGSHTDVTKQKETEIKLKNTLKEREVLLKEVHHRVKNNLQMLLSLSRLKSNAGKVDINDIEDSINSIARAYEAIYKSNKINKIPIAKHIDVIVNNLIYSLDIDFTLNAVKYESNTKFLIPIGLIITELVNNSIKHALPNSTYLKINIEIKKTDNTLMILYADNGNGFKDENLLTSESNTSFGISIINALTQQLNGQIQFYNQKGACTLLSIDLN